MVKRNDSQRKRKYFLNVSHYETQLFLSAQRQMFLGLQHMPTNYRQCGSVVLYFLFARFVGRTNEQTNNGSDDIALALLLFAYREHKTKSFVTGRLSFLFYDSQQSFFKNDMLR